MYVSLEAAADFTQVVCVFCDGQFCEQFKIGGKIFLDLLYSSFVHLLMVLSPPLKNC